MLTPEAHQEPKSRHVPPTSQSAPQLQSEPTSSTPTICRNKHWRHISSFHGPWLQLPPEVLESLAHSNYFSPRPRPIDPAVFFDLVKIRRLIEEATTLAVRASNGTASSALSNSLNASNGMLHGGSAAALGLGMGGGGANAKLSRERRHRMREHASQKLSHAFHLDEIAASVATMQSASALEEVAKYVLQRNSDDPDAKYVHFFHEKIPARALAASTSLQPLDEIIAQRPTEGAPFRTRAVTRILKEDFLGATKDLTDGLAVCRLYHSQHQKDKLQIAAKADLAQQNAPVRVDGKLDDQDQPSGLEPQMLFHRAGACLAIACDYIDRSLNGLKHATPDQTKDVRPSPSQLEGLEARKLVRTYAKRALRDYLGFLSHLDYTSGLPKEVTEDFFRKVNGLANGNPKSKTIERRLVDYDSNSPYSHALILQRRQDAGQHTNGVSAIPSLPPIQVHPINTLFSAVQPPNLPAYPPDTRAMVRTPERPRHHSQSFPSSPSIDVELHESLTYHPLLTDALHSLLLCHILIQTSRAELLRHAHMVARLARICDGYPIFLAARSPARADWIEVLRRVRAKDWIGLEGGWEEICRPAVLPGQHREEGQSQVDGGLTAAEKKKHEAVMEALADDRVDDEESFWAAVKAREMRAAREGEEQQRRDYLRSVTYAPPPSAFSSSAGDMGGSQDANGGEGGQHQSASASASGSGPKRWAQQDNGKEYPISMERAEALVRWVREAPPPGGEGTKAKGRKKKLAAGAGRKGLKAMGEEGDADDGVDVMDAERGLEGLSVD